MPTQQEIKVKAERVRAALTQEARFLHDTPGSARTIKTLSGMIDLDDNSLARLHDLIVRHPTRREAVTNLTEGMN